MAKKKVKPGDIPNPEDTETTETPDAWDKAGLETLNREELSETAGEFGIAFSDDTTNEELIKAILKAQEEDADSPQEDSEGDKVPGKTETTETPDKASPSVVSGKGTAPEDKIRIKNEFLKNSKVFLGNGELAEFDVDGIAEIEAAQAERLLKIPGYEKA